MENHPTKLGLIILFDAAKVRGISEIIAKENWSFPNDRK